MTILSSLVFVYQAYDVRVGKTKVNLVSYMVKDQLKYPLKCAKFASHFAEAVDKLSELQSLQNIYGIVRWLRFACEKWELSLHFLHAYAQTTNTKPAIDLFALRAEILSRKIQNCYLAEAPIEGTLLIKKGIKGPAIGRTLENSVIWRVTNPDKSNEEFLKEFEADPVFFMSDTAYK
jgi:hypothetical protein